MIKNYKLFLESEGWHWNKDRRKLQSILEELLSEFEVIVFENVWINVTIEDGDGEIGFRPYINIDFGNKNGDEDNIVFYPNPNESTETGYDFEGVTYDAFSKESHTWKDLETLIADTSEYIGQLN